MAEAGLPDTCPQEVKGFIATELLPVVAPSSSLASFVPEPLSGRGLMNQVFRVRLCEGETTAIVKHAPPVAALAPGIALTQARLGLEAKALTLLSRRDEDVPTKPPRLADIAARTSLWLPPSVTVPRPIRYQACPNHCLAMQDLGEAAIDLENLLLLSASEEGKESDKLQRCVEIGRHLGEAIARIHFFSWLQSTMMGGDAPQCAATVDNRDIQQTRLTVQYRGLKGNLMTLANELGVVDGAVEGKIAAASSVAEETGLAFLDQFPGMCLTQGDLWPRSVLLLPTPVPVPAPARAAAVVAALIDWEFSHTGNPAQDLAHLASHLQMLAVVIELRGRREKSKAGENPAAALLEVFLASYSETVGSLLRQGKEEEPTVDLEAKWCRDWGCFDSSPSSPLRQHGFDVNRRARVHACCEVVARLTAFREAGGYPFHSELTKAEEEREGGDGGGKTTGGRLREKVLRRLLELLAEAAPPASDDGLAASPASWSSAFGGLRPAVDLGLEELLAV